MQLLILYTYSQEVSTDTGDDKQQDLTIGTKVEHYSLVSYSVSTSSLYPASKPRHVCSHCRAMVHSAV